MVLWWAAKIEFWSEPPVLYDEFKQTAGGIGYQAVRTRIKMASLAPSSSSDKAHM
jgi:hypothetical protein